MITAAQLDALAPGDIVTVRCVVLSAGPRGDVGDALKVRTGDARGTVTIYVPLDQIVAVERGAGGVPAFPPVARSFLGALSDEAARDLAHAECLGALCGSLGRVLPKAA